MNWITRKFRNYVKPSLLYFYNLLSYFASSKKANTCIVLADFNEYGGTRTYFEQLCKFLKEKDKRVICLVCKKQKDEAFLELIHQLRFSFEVIPDQEYIIEYSGTWSLKLYFFYFNRLLSDLNFFISYCRKYKVSSFFISSGEPEKWLYLLWLPVSKMFYVLHTIPYRNIGSIGGRTLQKNLSVRKRVITVSDFSRKMLVRYWKLSQQQPAYVTVIYNFFEPSRNSCLKKVDNPIMVLTLGHVVPYKDPMTWINVAESVLAEVRNTPIEFVWAGDGVLLDECRRRVIDKPQIRFVGFTKDVDGLYSSAAIYFQPSLVESHGIAVIGAMYFELPCVVSDTGGLSESVKDNVNGYVIKPEDAVAFSKKIISLVNDSSERREMGQNSKILFNNKFSRGKWLQNMNRVI